VRCSWILGSLLDRGGNLAKRTHMESIGIRMRGRVVRTRATIEAYTKFTENE
jgi:hypothetical protein